MNDGVLLREEDNGIVLSCPADLLGHLPRWGPEWLVPGWLPEKVRALIRLLPKQVSQACRPLDECVGAFIRARCAAPGMPVCGFRLADPADCAVAEHVAVRHAQELVLD